MTSVLLSASAPSPQVMPFGGPASASLGYLRSAVRPWEAATTLGGLKAGGAAGKPIAPAGASALAHPCAEQQKHAVPGEHIARRETAAGWHSNGIAFGNQLQTRLSADVTRVDGPAGSPPRGIPA